MDAIEPGFRSEYEKICVGNKSKDAQDIFFEGMLLEPGLGTLPINVGFSSIKYIGRSNVL
jgi:hypothetical protein